MPGAIFAASARTESMPGATTRAILSAPAVRAVSSAWPSIERQATACSTFGTAERMRTPLPAARMTIKRGWLGISNVQATVCVAAVLYPLGNLHAGFATASPGLGLHGLDEP